MEAPKRKVTAKVSSQNVHGPGTNPSPSPSASPQLVRAKISSTARARTTSNGPASSTVNGTASPSPNVNGALRPQVVGAAARRSPSPAKMRPASPSKLQPQLRPAMVRAPLSKAATMNPPADRTRHGSISSMLSLTPASTISAPTTPLVRTDTSSILNGDASPRVNVDSGSNSFRVKSKVSGLAKPVPPPSLSTILSPPSPSSPSFPATNRPPRSRATTVAARRPSISFFGSDPQPSHSVIPPIVPSHEPPPLPTSPPASTLSFSSHSSASASASASASSAHSHSTSTGLTPPTSYINHARSESLPLSMVNLQPCLDDPSLSRDERTANPPPKRTLVARVRPGTRISGGRGRGWTSGSSVAGEKRLNSSDGARVAEMGDRSTDDSEHSVDEPRKRRTLSMAEDNPEDDVRAEAKSNRKIADLEITTRSLLTINSALEASKLRQAREIRELRRKLRETRLAMPPGKFRLLTEHERGEDGNRDTEEEEEDEDEKADGDECDEGFKRVKTLMEELLAAGRNALAVPAPSSLLSAPQSIGGTGGEPILSATAGHRLGLGIETGPMAGTRMVGTRMDKGEVLGWDVGSSLGTETGPVGGIESGMRRWKHGVAIGSKVLSPEEAKPWVGEEGDKEGVEEEDWSKGDVMEGGHGPDRVGSPGAGDSISDSCDDVEPDMGSIALS